MSKSVFFTKSAILSLVAKFACFILALKFSGINLINSGVVIYLLWSGILFSTAVRAVLVTKLVILGILCLTSFILALRVVLVAKLVISDILSSVSFILALSTFLTTSFFTTSLNLLKSTGTFTNLLTCNLCTFKTIKQLVLFLIYEYLIYPLQILSLLNQPF